MAKKDLRGTVRDWIIYARSKGIDLDYLDSDKDEDTRKLEALEIPQDENYTCHYLQFNEDNKDLTEFMSKHKSFCVRAIPLPHRKDLPRRPELGLKNFKECKQFLEEVVRGNEEDYKIITSEFNKQCYGGTLVSGDRYIRGEIAHSVADLCLNHTIPLASFEIDRGKVGHITDKTVWFLETDEKAKSCLWKALSYIKFGSESFNPTFHRGYFEFIVRKKDSGIRFIDYKDVEGYLV